MGMNFDDKTSSEVVAEFITQVMDITKRDALIGLYKGAGDEGSVKLLEEERRPFVEKAVETANYIIRAMERRGVTEPYLDYDGKDVYRCGYCHREIFHPSFTAEDDDEKNYRKFCFHCGRAVKWG